MLANLRKIKVTKPIWTLSAIVLVVLVVVAGCISTEKSIKAPDKIKAVQFGQSPLQIIGQKIYNNETGGDLNNLIFWSTNEGFASLGVGHFIWYPEGRVQRFKQTFPAMIRYLKLNGSDVPE